MVARSLGLFEAGMRFLVERRAMKRFLAVVFVCLPAFGQATYSGMAVRSGSAAYVASSSGTCAAPNFCAYTGADIIPWGTVPDFGGITNNNATAYDTSYLGHTN